MMDVKRIRKTINDAVEAYLLRDNDIDSTFDYSWICAQLSFACTIDAITIEERDALRGVVTHAYKTNRRGSECVEFQWLS